MCLMLWVSAELSYVNRVECLGWLLVSLGMLGMTGLHVPCVVVYRMCSSLSVTGWTWLVRLLVSRLVWVNASANRANLQLVMPVWLLD